MSRPDIIAEVVLYPHFGAVHKLMVPEGAVFGGAVWNPHRQAIVIYTAVSTSAWLAERVLLGCNPSGMFPSCDSVTFIDKVEIPIDHQFGGLWTIWELWGLRRGRLTPDIATGID